MTTATHAPSTAEPASVPPGPRPGSRADRQAHPRARDVVTETAVEFGVCVRPVLLRRTDTTSGETLVVKIPCGATRAVVCPSCADRARRVRAQQCREGWHLDHEPRLTPRRGDGGQRKLVEQRATATAELDAARDATARTAAPQRDPATAPDHTAA